jgi:hypothetical protein
MHPAKFPASLKLYLQCRLDPVVWGLGKPEFEREKHKVFNRNLLKYFLEN